MDTYVDNDTYVEYAKQDISTSWKKSLMAIITKLLILNYIILMYMYLQLHTSQGCFCPQTFFQNTVLNTLPWNSFV